MFVCQTSFQRRLLQIYGKEICLLDATYKTTRFDLPLFLLAVRTNVRYNVVATFIVQHETTDAISEALEIIKSWNEHWCPKHFMVDFSHAQINAVEGVFSGTYTRCYL